MINQSISETSVATTEVASASVKALMTKDAPAVIVPTLRRPIGLAPVDPMDFLLRKMSELAVTAVVITVTVPEDNVAVPADALAPVVIWILLPAVPKTRSPLVAVIAPNVAVIVVPAVIDVPAFTCPAVATMSPVVAVIPVPAVTVVVAETAAPALIFPAVAVISPAVQTMFPVVQVIPVPAVTVVVAEREVVVVKDPGATMAAGKDNVTTLATVLAVIWLAVPLTAEIAPVDPPKRTQLATPATTEVN